MKVIVLWSLGSFLTGALTMVALRRAAFAFATSALEEVAARFNDLADEAERLQQKTDALNAASARLQEQTEQVELLVKGEVH